MIKLVVADDEERVCRLIVALGNWEKLGIQVVGTAENGIEALDIIRREKVDILITDIRMPGYNGLELIEKVKQIAPEIKIMIISGYATFEYAQTAIKNGVNDYLLKPINREALNESLEKMASEIESERRLHSAFSNIQRERKEEADKIRNMLIPDLLRNTELTVSEEILREKYYFKAEQGCFLALAAKRDIATEEETSVSLIWEKMTGILEHELSRYCCDCIFTPAGEYLYGILNYAWKNQESVRKAVRSSLNQMLARNDFLGKSQLVIGLGSMVSEASKIPDTFTEARHAASERFLEGRGKVLEIDGSHQVLFEKKLTDKFARGLGNALETLNAEEIENTVKYIQKEALAASGVHGWEIEELVWQCGNIFILRMDFPDKKEQQRSFLEGCGRCMTVEELFQYFCSFMLEKIEKIISMREEDTVRPVRLAKQYIRNHYQEQITLEGVSEHVGLTTAYFSVLFKKETEIGFAKYLMNERIEGAKNLLRETNMSVGDICRKVGYNDLKHFTRLFEKNVGVKPGVYRKLYG